MCFQEDEEEEESADEYSRQDQLHFLPTKIALAGQPDVIDSGTEDTPIIIESSSSDEVDDEEQGVGIEEREGFRMHLSEVQFTSLINSLSSRAPNDNYSGPLVSTVPFVTHGILTSIGAQATIAYCFCVWA